MGTVQAGTILHVNDDPSLLALARTTLAAAGHQVVEAEGEEGALQALSAAPPDLVLLPTRLAGQDTAPLLAQLRDRAPGTPVLHLVAPDADPAELPEGYRSGEDGLLSHPVAPAALLAAVQLLLRLRRRPWQLAFDAVSDAMCILTADATVLACNQAMASLAGVELWQLEGSKCSDSLKEVHDLVIRPLLARLQESRHRETMESLYQGRWFQVTLDPVAGGAGGAVMTAVDITDRKLAEAEREQLLQENERQRTFLDAVLANAPEGVVVTDAEARVVLSNHAADEMLARPAPYGQPYETHARMQLIRPDGTPIPPRDLPLVRAALDGEVLRSEELAVIPPDGRRRDLLVNAAPVQRRDDGRIGAVVVFQDITEQKRAQRELARLLAVERERAQLASLFEAVLDYTSSAIGYLDRELNFVFVNPAFATGTGRSRQEFMGRNLRDFPVGLEMAGLVERVRDTGQPAQARDYPFQFPQRAEAGITFWDWFVTPVKDAGGAVQGLLLTAIEVTETVHVRERMAEAEQARTREARVLTSIEEAAPSMLAYLDRDLRYVHANSQYVAVLGMTREQVIGRTHREVFAQAEPWAVEVVERVCETGEELVLREVPPAVYHPTLVPEGGRYDLTITPVTDERGQVEGVVVFVMDVTEKVKQREALVAAERERAQLAEALNTEISHRVKNNLMAIAGLLQMQITAEPDSRIAAALKDAMARLLTFADIHAQLRGAPGEEMNLLDVLYRLGDTTRSAFSGIRVSLSVQGEAISYPAAAVTTLALVANELITNAIKHGAPASDGQRHVEVAAARQEDLLHLRVWNSGPPVPPDFDPHAQPGLGLRLVWDVIVGRHHGTFTLAPEGEGNAAEITVDESQLRQASD